MLIEANNLIMYLQDIIDISSKYKGNVFYQYHKAFAVKVATIKLTRGLTCGRPKLFDKGRARFVTIFLQDHALEVIVSTHMLQRLQQPQICHRMKPRLCYPLMEGRTFLYGYYKSSDATL